MGRGVSRMMRYKFTRGWSLKSSNVIERHLTARCCSSTRPKQPQWGLGVRPARVDPCLGLDDLKRGRISIVIIRGIPWPCVELPSFFILSKIHLVRSSLHKNVPHLCTTNFQNFHSAPCHHVTAAALNYYKIINATSHKTHATTTIKTQQINVT